jgi:hypothetical protein
MIKVVWTEEKKEWAIRLLTDYFQKWGTGECIAQGDNAQFSAIELVCQIADDVLIDGEGITYHGEEEC